MSAVWRINSADSTSALAVSVFDSHLDIKLTDQPSFFSRRAECILQLFINNDILDEDISDLNSLFMHMHYPATEGLILVFQQIL
jgi:hypothetical protein